MTFCSELVPAFKRAMGPMGTFDSTYPTVTDTELSLQIADGFAYSQLWGMLLDHVLNTATLEITEDLLIPEEQLVVLAAEILVVNSQVRTGTNKNKVQYVAGPVSYLAETSASVLSSQLAAMNDLWMKLVAAYSDSAAGGTDGLTYVFDSYYTRGLMGGDEPCYHLDTRCA